MTGEKTWSVPDFSFLRPAICVVKSTKNRNKRMTQTSELTAQAKVLVTKYILWWIASLSSFLLLVVGVVGFSVLSAVKENGEVAAKYAVQAYIEKLGKQAAQADQRIDSLVISTQSRIDQIVSKSDSHRINAIAEIQDALTKAELAEKRISQFEAEVEDNKHLVGALNDIAKDVNGLANVIASNKEFRTQVRSSLSNIPAGAVVAFNSKLCPDGWGEFSAINGRVIVGSGKSSELTERKLGETGGEESHRLTIEEMPIHNHSINDPGHSHKSQYMGRPEGPDHGWWGKNGGYAGWDTSKSATGITLGDSGGGGAHNNMQPYIALLYCVKR